MPQRLRISNALAREPLRVVYDPGRVDQEVERFCQMLAVQEAHPLAHSLALCAVAQGGVQLYPCLQPSPDWLSAAAHCVLSVAGGHICGLDGAAQVYTTPGQKLPAFVALAKSNKELLARLQQWQ